MYLAPAVQLLAAFLIVSLGQPSLLPLLGPVSAALGYTLFWSAISHFSSKVQRFLWAGLWYTAVCLVQLSWMSSIEFQGVYILLVWVAISLGVGLQFGLLTLLIPYEKPPGIPRACAVAALWTLIEWTRFHCVCGYSWNLSGLALSNPTAIQFASIFGVLGLSFWVILTNLMGLRALRQRKAIPYFHWALIAAVPYAFGLAHLGYHRTKMTSCEGQINCLLVQTGVLPPEKNLLEGRGRLFIPPYEQWRRILQYIAPYRDCSIDLIVLPESVVPFGLDVPLYNPKAVQKIFEEIFGPLQPEIFAHHQVREGVANAYWVQALAAAFNSDVVIGLDHTEPDGIHHHNSAFFARPHQSEFIRYDKRVLMPLAEYLPCQWLAPLVKAYGITDFFTPGKGPHLFDSKVPLAASICYEETFPSKVREGRLIGGELLVNVTNDGWYPFSRLSRQHLEHARLRTVENGVSMVRACNTGVTAAVDSLGRTLGQLQEAGADGALQKGALFVELPLYTYLTPFAIWGNGGILFLSGVCLGAFLLVGRKRAW